MQRTISIFLICSLLIGCKDSSKVLEGNRLITSKKEGEANKDFTSDEAHSSIHASLSQPEWAQLFGAAKTDWKSALAWIEQHIPKGDRDKVTAQLVKEICINDLNRTEEGLKIIQSSDLREDTLRLIIFAWKQADPLRLTAYAEAHLSGSGKNRAFSEALHQLMLWKDYDNAKLNLEKMPYSNERTGVLTQLATSWLIDDSAEAISWAKALDLQEDRNNALATIIRRLGETGKRKDLETLSNEMVDNNLKAISFQSLAAIIAKEDGIAKATDWLNGIPENYRSNVMRSIVTVAQKTDTGLATKLAFSISDPRERSLAISQVETCIIHSDPKDAVVWIETFPNEAAKVEAASQLAGSWYGIDSRGLSEWILTLPKGAVRDSAVDSLAKSLVDTDRRAAFEAAMTISDIQKRNAFLRGYHFDAKDN